MTVGFSETRIEEEATDEEGVEEEDETAVNEVGTRSDSIFSSFSSRSPADEYPFNVSSISNDTLSLSVYKCIIRGYEKSC